MFNGGKEMKIEKEIKKIIKDYAWTNEEGKSVLMEKEDIDNAVSELTNLFKTYARSLVPDMQHYDNDDVKNPELQFRLICAYKDGWNECREEMLNEIDNKTDSSLIVKDGWKINKNGKIEIQTGLDEHDDKWSIDKYRKLKGDK